MNQTPPPAKRDWPRFALSPEGMRAKFDCIGDVPRGWKLETPLPGTVEPEVEPVPKGKAKA